jgi:hypothetical protein
MKSTENAKFRLIGPLYVASIPSGFMVSPAPRLKISPGELYQEFGELYQELIALYVGVVLLLFIDHK